MIKMENIWKINIFLKPMYLRARVIACTYKYVFTALVMYHVVAGEFCYILEILQFPSSGTHSRTLCTHVYNLRPNIISLTYPQSYIIYLQDMEGYTLSCHNIIFHFKTIIIFIKSILFSVTPNKSEFRNVDWNLNCTHKLHHPPLRILFHSTGNAIRKWTKHVN
jgi:hypothetical protein